MKYFFVLLSLVFSFMVLGQPYTDENEPMLDDSIREKPETEDYQKMEEKQRQEEREVLDPSDPLGEFKEPRYDTGNGSTTNQKMNWPEP